MKTLSSLTAGILLLVCITLVMPRTLSAADDGPELAPAALQQAKRATVLVDGGREGSGSGFLVHSSGIFVTNAHVVDDVTEGSLKLVMNPGEADQKIVSARVILLAEDDDLALVKTDEPVTAAPLPLADEAGLVELSRVVVFGYPFGTRLAQGNEPYPTISINVGRISALRREGATLERIQIDAAASPGNSGGPVMDKAGKVIGIIVSGYSGNLNFAIPAAKLAAHLRMPVLSLRAPKIPYTQRADVREFELEVVPLAPVPADAELTVHFGELGTTSRKSFPAARRNGRYYVRAAPVDAASAKASLRLRLRGVFDQLKLIANFDDCPVRIGNRSLRLSEISKIQRKTDPEKNIVTVTSTLTHFDKDRETYETVVGPVSGLPTVQGKINPVVVKYEDAESVTMGVYDAGVPAVPYEVTLSSKGKVLASCRGSLNFSDPPPGMIEGGERTLKSRPGILSGESGLNVASLINPTQDVKQGTWTQADGGLATRGEASAWCEVPVMLGKDYTLNFDFIPKQSSKGELLVQLPVGTSETLLHLDGAKGIAKLDLAAGARQDRESSAPIPLFTADQPYQVRVSVNTVGKYTQIFVSTDNGPRPLVWGGLTRNLAPAKGLPIAGGRLGLGHQGLEMELESLIVEGKEGVRVLREFPGAIHHTVSKAGRWTLDDPVLDGNLPGYAASNSATLVGSAEVGVSPGVLGAGAMRLSGEAGAGFVVAETQASTLRPYLHRTVSMWFRADGPLPANQRQYIYDEGSSEKGFALYLQGNTLIAGGWDPKAEWKGTWLKAPGIVTGKWYHVALVIAGKSEAHDSPYRFVDKQQAFRLSLNGMQVGVGFGQYIAGPRELISVGTIARSSLAHPEDVANRAVTNRQFVGMIDEVEIFNSQLGPSAIAILAGGRFGINAMNDQPVRPKPNVNNPGAVRPGAAPPPPKPVAPIASKIDRTNPAKIEVPTMPAATLAAASDKTSGIWEKVPEDLRGATFFYKPKQPYTDVKVIQAGRVYLACDYAYQGNPNGGWQSEVTTKENLLKDGWSLVLTDLKMWDRPETVMFTKILPADAEFRVRCNKYHPPVVIVFQ